MAVRYGISAIRNADKRGSKSSSTGQGGRGRRVKISTSTMNKHKRKSHKLYRGQGR
jgi:hypothetical protein